MGEKENIDFKNEPGKVKTSDVMMMNYRTPSGCIQPWW